MRITFSLYLSRLLMYRVERTEDGGKERGLPLTPSFPPRERRGNEFDWPCMRVSNLVLNYCHKISLGILAIVTSTKV